MIRQSKNTILNLKLSALCIRSGDDWNCDTCKSGAMELGGFLTSDKGNINSNQALLIKITSQYLIK